MALTVTPVAVFPSGLKQHVPGDLREGIVSLTFGGADTYVTGGFAVTPATFGFNQTIVFLEPALSQNGAYSFVYQPATGKVKVYSAAGTELVNASAALQNDTVYLQAIGY